MDSQTFSSWARGAFFAVLTVVLVIFMFRPPLSDLNVQTTQLPFSYTISVDGEGELDAKPDMAVVNLSVVEQGATVQEATNKGNAKMAAVTGFLKGLGISEDDLKTTNYFLGPEYRYPQDGGKPQIASYSLNQNVRVKIRDLSKVEAVIDGAVQAGVNQTGQLSFEIDDDSDQQREARAEAFADARKKAEEMATAAGVRLGRVVSFYETSGFGQPPMPYMSVERAVGTLAADVASSIETGSQEVKVTVNVTYEIE